jgi:hypothetical protein
VQGRVRAAGGAWLNVQHTILSVQQNFDIPSGKTFIREIFPRIPAH